MESVPWPCAALIGGPPIAIQLKAGGPDPPLAFVVAVPSHKPKQEMSSVFVVVVIIGGGIRLKLSSKVHPLPSVINAV